jgi:putative ABC transport system substrate-binding protein
MKRRTFISLLGGAAAWPIAAHAQQPTPIIGYLAAGSSAGFSVQATAFIRGLAETGYLAGQNVSVEYRWADGRYERLPALAAELVQRKVSLIAANPSPAAVAAKAATTTIPIVFTSGFDPVRLGLVESMNRPGGNVTGVMQLSGELAGKRLSLLKQLLPSAAPIGFLVNPSNPNAYYDIDDMVRTAGMSGQDIMVLKASTDDEVDRAFASLVKNAGAGLVIGADQFFVERRTQIVVLAARHTMPSISENLEYAQAGGLLAYGPSRTDYHRLAGTYAGRILRGANPADLPVIQPTKFELAINLRTAKALGLNIPPTLLALADEVIE